MKSVVTNMNINCPVNKVWEVLAMGGGLDKWFPVIASCELSGKGAGAKRVCKTIEGAELKETILTIDPEARVFQYSIDEQSMMPTTNVIGTMHVTGAGNDTTNVMWIANFNLLDPSMEEQVKAGIDQLYQSGIKGLESFINNN